MLSPPYPLHTRTVEDVHVGDREIQAFAPSLTPDPSSEQQTSRGERRSNQPLLDWLTFSRRPSGHLLALGATRAEVGQKGDEGFTVLADPEGNEFCVLHRH
jgi:hypothetical protein